MEIFRMNIQRLKEIEEHQSKVTKKPALVINESQIMRFAEEHFDNNTRYSGRWNGRQIRNAFQIAASLSYYEARLAHTERLKTDPEAQPEAPTLDVKQFGKVEEATKAFDKYMEETKGWNDAEMAHLLGERADYIEQMKSMRIIDKTIPPRAEQPSSAVSSKYGRSASQRYIRGVEGSAQRGKGQRNLDPQSPTPAHPRQRGGDRSVSTGKFQHEQPLTPQNVQTSSVNRRTQRGQASVGYGNQRFGDDRGTVSYDIEQDSAEEFNDFPNEDPNEYGQEVYVDSEDDGSQY